MLAHQALVYLVFPLTSLESTFRRSFYAKVRINASRMRSWALRVAFLLAGLVEVSPREELVDLLEESLKLRMRPLEMRHVRRDLRSDRMGERLELTEGLREGRFWACVALRDFGGMVHHGREGALRGVAVSESTTDPNRSSLDERWGKGATAETETPAVGGAENHSAP